MSQPADPASRRHRPDPGLQLQEAVRQRQSSEALRLAQHWVHRQGLTSLQHFCHGPLQDSQGEPAVVWFQALLERDGWPLTPQPSRPVPVGSSVAPPPAAAAPEAPPTEEEAPAPVLAPAPVPAMAEPSAQELPLEEELPAVAPAPAMAPVPALAELPAAQAVPAVAEVPGPAQTPGLELEPGLEVETAPEASPLPELEPRLELAGDPADPLGLAASLKMVLPEPLVDAPAPATGPFPPLVLFQEALPGDPEPGPLERPTAELPGEPVSPASAPWPVSVAPATEPSHPAAEPGERAVEASQAAAEPNQRPVEARAMGAAVNPVLHAPLALFQEAPLEGAGPAAPPPSPAAGGPEPGLDPLASLQQRRAEAAVDEAFAALAQSFDPPAPQDTPPQALPSPQPPLPSQEPLAGPAVPEPLAPALAGSASGDQPPLPPRREPAPSRSAPAVVPPEGWLNAPLTFTRSTPASPVAPVALAAPQDSHPPAQPDPSAAPQAPPSASHGPSPVDGVAQPGGEEPPASGGDAQGASEAVAGADTDQTSEALTQAGLVERLRGSLSRRRLPELNRLRGLVRDCVEETVSLLRSPSQEADAQAAAVEAATAAFEVPPTTAAETAAAETAATPPAAVEPSPPPAEAAEAAAAPARTPGRVLSSLVARRGVAPADRRAPAPSALSDLRAWLPDASDLPRAS